MWSPRPTYAPASQPASQSSLSVPGHGGWPDRGGREAVAGASQYNTMHQLCLPSLRGNEQLDVYLNLEFVSIFFPFC